MPSLSSNRHVRPTYMGRRDVAQPLDLFPPCSRGVESLFLISQRFDPLRSIKLYRIVGTPTFSAPTPEPFSEHTIELELLSHEAKRNPLNGFICG